MISVCMATYNGAEYIKKQLDSVIEQLSFEDEIIISDDGSTDDTIQIIEKYNDNRIKVLYHTKATYLEGVKYSTNFVLAAANFENALQAAKGDYIFLCDQDDIWCPNKRIRMLDFLKENDIVMSNFALIDANDNIRNNYFYKKSPISKYLIKNIISARFLGCCMAFNRNVLNYILPFPRKLIGHDYWIGCLGVKKFKFYFINEPLHLYRRTNTNVSTACGKSNNSLIYKISYRLVFLMQCIIRIISRG